MYELAANLVDFQNFSGGDYRILAQKAHPLQFHLHVWAWFLLGHNSPSVLLMSCNKYD